MADSDVDTMSLKELKELIAKAGLNLDGCIEKPDIRARAREAQAVVVSGWSRAEKVSGSADSGYAIYADIAFKDGTKMWGYSIPFETGTHPWEFKVRNPKP